MGFFGFLGKAAKAVGKGVLAVGKTAAKVANTAIASYTGISLLPQPSVAGEQVNGASPITEAQPSYQASNTAGSAVNENKSLTGLLLDVVKVAGGNRPIQTEVSANANQLPSWAIPVGLCGALLIGLIAVTKKR